jgi:hypothetical protein
VVTLRSTLKNTAFEFATSVILGKAIEHQNGVV